MLLLTHDRAEIFGNVGGLISTGIGKANQLYALWHIAARQLSSIVPVNEDETVSTKIRQ